MIRTYHQSQIQDFLMCQKRHEFRYIDKIRMPSSTPLTLGGAVDVGANHILVHKKTTGELPTLDAALDAYSSEFTNRASETDWKEDDAGKIKDVGVQLTTLYLKEVAPTFMPATVQEKFEIEIPEMGIFLAGTIDVTDTEGRVRDTKTAKLAYSEDDIPRAIQPAMYTYAVEALTGVAPTGWVYDVLIKPTARKPAEYKPVQGPVTEADQAWLFDTIKNMHDSLNAGIAMPAPDTAWWCSKDYCPYWSMCKGKK